MAVISAITNVFGGLFDWIVTAVNSIVPIFYTAPTGNETVGQLTFFGALAVAGLGISVFFLLMGLIQNFLHLRG